MRSEARFGKDFLPLANSRRKTTIKSEFYVLLALIFSTV